MLARLSLACEKSANDGAREQKAAFAPDADIDFENKTVLGNFGRAIVRVASEG